MERDHVGATNKELFAYVLSFPIYIQLACAKAFLNYKANGRDYILVEQSDLHQRVNKGLMKLQEFRGEVDELLRNMGDVLRFSYKDNENTFNMVDFKEECPHSTVRRPVCGTRAGMANG